MMQRPIRVGTDCSGIDTPVMALEALQIDYEHIFSCEKDEFARKAIEHNFTPSTMYKDITTRVQSHTPKVDLYICGFPCQSFSNLGKKTGFSSSPIFFYARDYIAQKRPEIFLLENVKALKTNDRGRSFERIMNELNSIGGYIIYHAIINTLDHGLPQSRNRLYILGVNRDGPFNKQSIQFPPPPRAGTRPTLSSFLKGFSDWNDDEVVGRFRKQQPHKAKPLMEEIEKFPDLMEKCYCTDLSCSTGYRGTLLETSPCLKSSRCDYFISGLDFSRSITPREALRLQGVPDYLFKQVCSDRQTYKQAGNAMSVNVIQDIFSAVLGQQIHSKKT